jgi:3-dehydroquinate synthase
MSTVIGVGDRYDVVIGRDLLASAADALPAAAEQVLVVHSAALPAPAEAVAAAVAASGRTAHLAAVPDAEAAKTAAVAADLWGTLGRHGFTRTDAVVAVGGGTVTDLGGFVAASWLRGVPVVQVPTTLLAMVDAAVGGKTGINTAEGKNLVGAFHEPAGVVIDLALLRTLPTVDYVAGLAEVVKAGFIADPVILDLIEADPGGATRWDGPHAQELIERAIRVKAEVVAADLRESFLREILNYGHTFGHAIEQVEDYRRRHGEAVAIGMVYAAELARCAGHLGDELVARHRAILDSVGLPTAYAGNAGWADLLTAMRRDKKSRGARLRFVVLDDIARPARLEGPSEDCLREAFTRTRA